MRLCLALLCALAACSSPQTPAYQSTADRIMVIIPRGATYYQALDSLESRGVIESRDWFSLYARIRGLPSNLKSGVLEQRGQHAEERPWARGPLHRH